MKRKLYLVVLICLLFTFIAAVFAACSSNNMQHIHNYSLTQVTPPTCTEQGYTTHTCSCGDHYTDNFVAALGHTESDPVIENNIAATCEQEGSYDEVIICAVCHEEIRRTQIKTEKLEHEYSEWIISTECENNGEYTVRYCLDCHYIDYNNETVVLHPHAYSYIGSKQATCTESGYTALFRCEKCGHEVMEEIEPLGHIDGPVYYEDGDRHYSYCSRPGCGDKIYDNHNYHSWKVEKISTCTEYGQYSAICRDCGHVGYFPISPQHIYDDGTETKEPTCTEDGEKTRKCVFCGIPKIESISALGHVFSAWEIIKESNCTEEGEAKRKCSRCGVEETDILPISHTWGEWFTIKEFTCTENGAREHTCTLCGTTEQETVYARHTFDEGMISSEPTCTQNGEIIYCCTICGVEISEDISALGHEIERQVFFATCTVPGYYVDICTRCGESSFIGIAALGHDWEWQYNELEHHRECTRCQEAEQGSPHEFETIFRSTEISEGYRLELLDYCFACDYEKLYGQTVIHIHNNVEIISDGRATCTEDGLLPGLVCATCNEVLVGREPEEALGHDYENGICRRCGDTQIELTLSDDGTFYIVTGIGEYTGSELIIPESYNGIEIKEIGESAFSNCRSLTSITIPVSVTIIGEWAFYDCYSLEAVYITDLEAWCNIAFGDSYANPLYYAHNLYLNGELVTELIIPDGISEIKPYAFYYCDSLTSITFGENSKLTSIGYSAFSGCRSLTSITIPVSVTSIGVNAFYNCNGLKGVYITDIEAWCNISFSNYGSNPLAYAHNLYLNDELVTQLIIPNRVTEIKDYAFYGCTSLTSITISNSVTSIGISAFRNCTNIIDRENGISYVDKWVVYCDTSVITAQLRDNTIGIANSVFSNLSSLKSITIPEGVTSIGEWAFEDCYNLTSITIPRSVTSIGYEAFARCTSLTSITIPEGMISIGECAFYDCNNLASITIPKSVTSIGGAAFAYCVSLESVYITDLKAWCNITFDSSSSNPLSIANNLYLKGKLVTELVLPADTKQIGSYAFYDCDNLTSITILNGVTDIGEFAFYNCSSLTNITIPSSVKHIGFCAFADCNSLTIYCEVADKPSGWDSSWNFSWINYTSCPVVWDCNNNSIATDGYIYTVINGLCYRLRDGVAEVACQPTYITGKIIIPSSVTYNVMNYTITSIGRAAFSDCTSLTSITIPDSVTSIDYDAFLGCSSLESITIPDTVTSIGESAFSGCNSLESITIPDSVTSIGNVAFYDCSSLTIYCEVASKPSDWSSSWYGNCPVVWDCSNNEVADDGYIYAIIDNLRYGLKDGNAMVVRQPSNISGEIVIASTVEYNGTTYTVTSIGESAFSGCSSITSITFGENSKLTSIGDNTFYGCSSLTSITIPSSVTIIGTNAFYNCSSLTSITIPDSVTSIGEWAFYDCYSLENVYYAGTAEDWEEISIDSLNFSLTEAKRYYYSETEPVVEGNYWHYVDGVVTVW